MFLARNYHQKIDLQVTIYPSSLVHSKTKPLSNRLWNVPFSSRLPSGVLPAPPHELTWPLVTGGRHTFLRVIVTERIFAHLRLFDNLRRNKWDRAKDLLLSHEEPNAMVNRMVGRGPGKVFAKYSYPGSISVYFAFGLFIPDILEEIFSYSP